MTRVSCVLILDLPALPHCVFKDNIVKTDLAPAIMEQARVTLQKCGGLPLAITTIGGFLATKPKTAIEWRKMNECISSELEINPELMTIKSILMRSYDGLPYHLKYAFLYLSIFPEDHRIRWGRLMRRWIAEGYSRDMLGITAAELCRSNWKRDKDVLESMLDLSHVRSLTVFGEWRSFFISENMRFVRVLDLEDTLGFRDHHLDQIGQLRHLKYLSFRGCCNIFCLPNSFGNLRHLETLDVRGTRISELPTIITDLRKLQNLHADDYVDRFGVRVEDDIVDKYQGYIDRISTGKRCSVLLSSSHVFLRPQVLDAGLNRYDIFNLYRFQERNLDGIILPKGIGKLKALHALGAVDVSGRNGNATVKEFGELTQLRKLKVGGLSYRNINELWSAIADHNQLQSLSVEIGDPNEDRNELDGCFGEGLLPPSSLENLALHGKLVNVTEWIHRLQNLSKLVLKRSRLEQDDAIQAIGVLPNIAVLRLQFNSFMGAQLHFQGSSFPSLLVLWFDRLDKLRSVLFEEGTMPKLELLQIGVCTELKVISGLPALKSLKEIQLPLKMVTVISMKY
uniref:Disease resistance R13L4/SHOC-2-like LRR domain-containing protein n=1 Tax=Aegilops tauschii subsp. strangulata TaxID=200361 RepID=A0A453MSD3_AEGTS